MSELVEIRKSVRNAIGAIESHQVADKDVHGTLTRVLSRLDGLITADQLADKRPVVVQFGNGRLVVGTGTSPVLPGAYLVIINPAVEAGHVGELVHEREKRTAFFGDEIVMAFPTFEQACRVADALCNIPLDRENQS